MGSKIRHGSVVIEGVSGNGSDHKNNMFTLLNAPNKNPYIKEFGGRTQSLFPDQIKSKTSMSQIKTPIEKKGGKEFQFSKIRVPVQMLSEYIQEFDPANQTPHDKGIKSLDI